MISEATTTLSRNNHVMKSASIALINDLHKFHCSIEQFFKSGESLCALYGTMISSSTCTITAVLGNSESSQLRILRTLFDIEHDSWESITPKVPAAHLFEREMAENLGIAIKNHPWLKPVRHSNKKSHNDIPGEYNFYSVSGTQIHEVAVGPVHAGIIEPGHFRFQCSGETVHHLEIVLGYQHRGIEKSIIGGPTKKTIFAIETIAGDTSVGHSIAYCELLESLSQTSISPRAQAIRGMALELERMANHTGDLGALALDIGFLPTAAYCGRIRGDILNMSALICGSRFGRGLIRPGGVAFDIDNQRSATLLQRLKSIKSDLSNAIELLWETPSVLVRFENIGAITLQIGLDLGLVGPSARACGLGKDCRHDFPEGIFQFSHIPVSTWHTGDVFGRAYVRWLEIQRSTQFIETILNALPEGEVQRTTRQLMPSHMAVSLVEGWRGEICHCIETDQYGAIAAYKIVDPSFHNWTGLAMALRNQQISDFPICNKSFNLSYCGHDL